MVVPFSGHQSPDEGEGPWSKSGAAATLVESPFSSSAEFHVNTMFIPSNGESTLPQSAAAS